MYGIARMNCILEPADTVGGLYLGDLDAASDVTFLENHKISAVLTVAYGTRLSYPKSFTHNVIMANDIETFNLGRFFDRGIDFIDRMRNSGKSILVHCFAGVSRSATMTIAYLMKTQNMNYIRAHEFTKSRRRVICPNPGFRNQLREFEKRIRDPKLETPPPLTQTSANKSPVQEKAFGSTITRFSATPALVINAKTFKTPLPPYTINSFPPHPIIATVSAKGILKTEPKPRRDGRKLVLKAETVRAYSSARPPTMSEANQNGKFLPQLNENINVLKSSTFGRDFHRRQYV